MKRMLFFSLLVLGLVFVTSPAMADLIGPSLGTGVNDEDGFFDTLLGFDVTLLDKYNEGEGVLPGTLIVTDFGGPDDPTATISWDLTGSGFMAWIVAVKDGSNVGPDTHWLYYTISESQRLIGGGDVTTQFFSPNAGGISHISLYGAATAVPEPATMLLLGSGLIGLAGVVRRRFRK